MNWHTTTLDDLDILHKCAFNNGFFANNYSAVNSVLYAQKFNSLVSTEGDWIYEKYFEDGKLYFSFPHNINGDNGNIEDVVKALLKEASNEGNTCVFRNITSDERGLLLKHFTLVSDKKADDLSDYIYLSEKLSTLSGKKYNRKRNHIKQFFKKYGTYTFEPMNNGNLDAAYSVEEKWLAQSTQGTDNTAFSEDLQKEHDLIRNAFDHFDFFSNHAGMTGGIVFVGVEPVAFCLASVISPSMTDVHFEKCLSEYARDGGYAIINNEFAKTVSTTYINREEDLGIEGLRKSKLSYYPEIILEKYNVEIRLS